MDSDRLNRWLTLGANIGVLVGIIFLAIEIGQNQSTLEEANRINFLEARATELDQYNSFRALVAQDEQLSKIWFEGLAGAELNPLESARFGYLCKNYIWIGVVQFERSIVLGEVIALGTVKRRAERLSKYPGYLTCWNNEKDAVRTYGFETYVDAIDSGIDLGTNH